MERKGKNSGRMSREAECAEYFRVQRGYDRVFAEMIKKVRSYGRVGGTVTLDSISEDEKRALEGVFGEPVRGESCRFSLKKFENALQGTRFAGVSLIGLLEEYSGEQIFTNKEIKEREASARREEQRKLEETVDAVLARVKSLPEGGHIRLAVLAMEALGDPHALDAGTKIGDMLVERLYRLQMAGGTAQDSIDDNMQVQGNNYKTAEGRLECLLRAGIRPDDISSFTTLFGIDLVENSGDGDVGERDAGERDAGERTSSDESYEKGTMSDAGLIHPGFSAFNDRFEPFLVSLSNLADIVGAKPRGKAVYVIENQMVFSELCERCKGASIICTSGQPKVASLLVLDLLCDGEYEIYYCGDTDPEGIAIADRIYRRSGGRICPWHMTMADYEKSLSSVVVKDPSRLKKMDRIESKVLKEVCDSIRESGKVGYQEMLIEDMVREIRGTLELSHNF